MPYENEEMEMSTPCIHCGEIFDLYDGYSSEKWHENKTICESCFEKEKAEIEEDDRWCAINSEVASALYGLYKEEKLLHRLSDNNKKKIKELSALLDGSSSV